MHFCREASHAGLAALRFDFSGLGNSEGRFEDTTVAGYVEDLVSAATWLQAQGLEVLALIGHSLGGAISILAAHRLTSVRGVGVVAASSDLEELHRRLIPDGELPDQPVTVRIGGSTFR